MKPIAAILAASATLCAFAGESILDEVNAGRKRTADAVQSYYVRYTAHHVTIEREDGAVWVRDVEVVTERWRDGDNHRVRRHSVETNTKDGNPVEKSTAATAPQKFQYPYRAMERDALLTPTEAFDRSRHTLGPDAEIHINPPSGAVRPGDRLRKNATSHVRPRDWLDQAFRRYMTAAHTDWMDPWDFAAPIDDRATMIWSRHGPFDMATFRSEQGGDPFPGYILFDPARGHLALASEEGSADWADRAVLSGEIYSSVHIDPVEAAPGIWLPQAITDRYLASVRRSHTELRVLELRVNEPIDRAVFDKSNAGRWHTPRPASSVFPGDVVPVYRASMDEVTGERERRAALEDAPPAAILHHPLRGDDGLPPIPSQPTTSSTPAFDGHAALRWLVGIAVVGVFLIVVVIRREGQSP